VTSNKPRKIIHIDADAFYASVEIRENPSLATQPIAVGGAPSRRGVIATCNYIARQFGVHSAMPSSHALRLCPQLVFIKPHFELYRTVSFQIREIMSRYTTLIEPLSLDEAYLDVSDSSDFNGSATLIAQAIRNDVQSELSLCVSAGVAPNKFLAKIASDWEKPDGLFVITPDQVDTFIENLSVSKINGVGKVTTQKLNNLGVYTCGDLRQFDEATLNEKFGRYGSRLYQLARGIDHRPVETTRIRKSLSVEHTFEKDFNHTSDIQLEVEKIFLELCQRANKLKPEDKIHKRFVKVKFNDFTQTTLEESINTASILKPSDWQNLSDYSRMINQAYLRSEKPIRLLGMGVRLLAPAESGTLMQLSLFDDID